MKTQGFPGKTALWLLVIWMVVTTFNINKAVTIDDAAYVEAARVMTHDFWNVMHYTVDAGPIYAFDQPHFFLYFLAGAMKIGGESEASLHLATALFSGMAILFFYLLARYFAPGHELLLTAVFAIGPAFMSSQNLMCDVPMLALWLVFFWATLCPSGLSPLQRRGIAAFALSCACLTKYTSLILLPVLFIDIAARKQWRHLWAPLVPLAALVAWSAWNYYSYGGIHLLERQRNGAASDVFLLKSQSWLLCVGAVLPTAVFFVVPLFAARRWRYALVGVALAGIVAFCFTFLFSGEVAPVAALRAAFFMLGILAALGIVASLHDMWLGSGHDRTGGEAPKSSRADVATLGTFVFLHTAFAIQLTPFLAIRHVLPIMTLALLLLGQSALPHLKPRHLWVGAALSMLLGVVISISDWQYANVYRQQAPLIRASLPARATVWHAGRWGWEWYAAKSGIKLFDPKHSIWHTGDYLVVPQIAGWSNFSTAQLKQMQRIRTVEVPGSIFNACRTMLHDPWGGFYFQGDGLPWTFSSAPLERFVVYKIDLKR